MTSAKKKGGLGAELYFENIPTLEPVEDKQAPTETDGTEKPAEKEPVASTAQPEEVSPGEAPIGKVAPVEIPAEEPVAELAEEPVEEVDEEGPEPLDSEETEEPAARQKIRRTYALYEETQIALEEMKLAARKQGMKMTLGDLLEEAVQLLMAEKGMAPQESRSH